MRIGMGPDVVAFLDRALQERPKFAIADEITRDEYSRFDLALLQRVQDRRGALAEIATGENQRKLLHLHVAANDRAVFVANEVIGRRSASARSANQSN